MIAPNILKRRSNRASKYYEIQSLNLCALFISRHVFGFLFTQQIESHIISLPHMLMLYSSRETLASRMCS